MEVITVEDFMNKVKEYNYEDINKVRCAYKLAYNLHKGQYRQSGEEYIMHPLTVAYILTDMYVDSDTLCAALLHDTVEDCNITLEEIEELFNKDVAMLVDGVTKISKMNYSSKKELNNANMRKIVTSITKDIRIIIIKLADRLHNMRTLDFKTLEKQKENAHETLDLFVNLARNIGAYKIMEELEDLSLKYINRSEYDKVYYNRAKVIFKHENYLREMRDDITNSINDKGINNNSYLKYMNIYGIYKKLINGYKISDIHNLLSLIINTDDVSSCYLILGIVHDLYNPINYEFTDYICRPKTNMYSSLHTTVFGPNNSLVQAQIRTYEMDKIAINGIAAYWGLYKGDARRIMQEELEHNYQFFDSLVEINNMFPDNEEFAEKVSDELFSDKIYVYTSKGKVVELPVGSTIVDFIYKTGYGSSNTIVGAMVNDELREVNYVLQNNDRINLIDNKYLGGPKVNWDTLAKTTLAKKRIREFNEKKSNN